MNEWENRMRNDNERECAQAVLEKMTEECYAEYADALDYCERDAASSRFTCDASGWTAIIHSFIRFFIRWSLRTYRGMTVAVRVREFMM